MTLKFWRLADAAILPSHGRVGDIGYDLHCLHDEPFVIGEQRLVRTGISVQIPNGYYGRIADRSGLSLQGFDVGGGVIDPNYSGEISVILRRVVRSDVWLVTLPAGKAVAQLVLERAAGEFVPTWEDGVREDTARGSGGFGSSGR